MAKTVKECFSEAKKLDEKGKKHKGLLLTKPDPKKAEAYILKAKMNLNLCDIYKEKHFDYMIEEAWYYTMYYCALAILSQFGVESRSQDCTAKFLYAVKQKGIVALSDDFIQQITVHSDKGDLSAVDAREQARYGASITSEQALQKYVYMMDLCRKYISEAEEIVYSSGTLVVPNELMK